MTADDVLQVGYGALSVAMMVAAPVLLTALAIGLFVGIIQAATQIQEMTLSFIPKLIGIAVVLLLAGQWMLTLMVDWFQELVTGIPALLG